MPQLREAKAGLPSLHTSFSLLAMLEFRGKHLIGRPAAGYPSAHDFPPHPERITSPTPTDQSKQSRSTAISTLVKIREELAGDLGCFLTGFSDLTLQVAHLVNAVRKDEVRRLQIASISLFHRRQPLIITVDSSDQFFVLCAGHYSYTRRLQPRFRGEPCSM